MTAAASADLRTLARDLTQAGQNVEATASRLLDSFGAKVLAEAQSNAPVRTGALKGSITVSREGRLKVIIGPSVHYGVFQEFGTGTKGEFPTGSYVIKPKQGKLLHFQVNGQNVFVGSVTHPGVKAQPYMRKAFASALEGFLPELMEAGQASITKGPNA